MDVSDAAVEMGPRNQRRLVTGAVVAGVTVAVAGFAMWFFGSGLPFAPSGSHGSSSTPPVPNIVLIPEKYNLSAGMTKQQILHRLGKPEQSAGQCWQYPEHIKNFTGGTINAVRLCFYGNQYQNWFEQLNGKWVDAFSGSDAVIAPPTGP